MGKIIYFNKGNQEVTCPTCGRKVPAKKLSKEARERREAPDMKANIALMEKYGTKVCRTCGYFD